MILALTAAAVLAFGALIAPLAGAWATIPTLAAAALAGGGAAWGVLSGGPAAELAWPWALPGASLHFGFDALSACFLVLILVVTLCAGIYGEGYIAASHGHLPARSVRFFFMLLAAAMALLVCARNAFLFMVAWEVMALSAFGLVSAEHGRSEVRRAALLYLLCTHVGSICLLAFFAILGRRAGSLDFSAFAAVGSIPPSERWALFALALTGFGMKAGLFPLHIWLQEAHPAAPSHASAVMSGAMIEMGLYGLLRFLSLLGPLPKGAAIFLAGLGLATALFGILFAAMQRDFKRLLAYSSIENVGLMLAGLGLGAFGQAVGRSDLALLGFAGAILHALNHGLFKPLLFLGAGAVYQTAGTRDLESLGGLQKRMPWTAAFIAVGAAAIAALPPLNGFTGEWLLYNWLLRPGSAADPRLAATAAAVIALVGGTAVVAFSKFCGIALLGSARSEACAAAHDPSWLMLAPMALLAAPCVVIGLWPGPAVRAAFAAAGCVGMLPVGDTARYWAASLSHVGLVGGAVCAAAIALWLLRGILLGRRPVASGGTWGCGFTAGGRRMQYTSSSYQAPAARPFSAWLAQRRWSRLPAGYWPLEASFESSAPDPVLERALPAATRSFGDWLAVPRKLQQGRLQPSLLYISAFLVLALLWKL